MKAQDNDIPKLKQSTIEKHEVKAEKISFPIVGRRFLSEVEIEAIAFAEWIMSNNWRMFNNNNLWINAMSPSVYITTSELYSLFKESTK